MPTKIETKALAAAKKQIILAMQLHDFGHEDAKGNFRTNAPKIYKLEECAAKAAEAAIRAYLAALDSPIGEQGVKPLDLANLLHHAFAAGGRAQPWTDYDPATCHAYARILSALSPERKEPGWRDIASAPRDGTKILLAKIVGHPDHPTALWWATRGYWSDKWKNWNDGFEPSGLADPTHWLPMSAHGVGAATPEQPT